MVERSFTLELAGSFKESEYYGMASSLHSHPLFLFLAGHRHRSDFLYVSTKTGVPLLYRWDPIGKEGQMLTPGDEPIFPYLGSAALHRSKPLVVFPKDKGGNANYAIYLLDYSRNDLQQVKGPIGRVFYTFWVHDDKWIIVGHDKQSMYARTLLRDGTTEDLYTTDKQVLGAAYDNEKGLLVISVGRGEDSKLAIIDTFDAKVLQWVPEAGIPPFYPPSVFPEKRYLAYSTDAKRTHQEVVVRSIETLEEVARVAVPGYGSLEWMDENHLFGVILRDGRLSPRLLDIRTGEWTPPLAEISALFSTVTKDGPVWVANSFFQPPFLQAIRNEKLVTLIPPSKVVKQVSTEGHYYPSFDERKAHGWLLRNPNPKAPLVVYLHGGPTAIQGDWWFPDIPALVLAGFHVFAPNFRGSDGFGMEFRDLNIGDLGGGDLRDVLYGARYAMKILGIDKKPALVGGSYGAYLTLQGLTTLPGEWAGGVALAPITDWREDYFMQDAHYRQFCIHFFGGTPAEKPDLYRERSPITHLKRLKAPVLILHGENDRITPLEPVKKFYEEAAKRGVSVELVITRDEGHGSLHDMNAIRDTVLTLEHLKRVFQSGADHPLDSTRTMNPILP